MNSFRSMAVLCAGLFLVVLAISGDGITGMPVATGSVGMGIGAPDGGKWKLFSPDEDEHVVVRIDGVEGPALMGKVVSASNSGIQIYQYRLAWAVWADGTVVWADDPDAAQDHYSLARVPSEIVRTAAGKAGSFVSKGSYRDPGGPHQPVSWCFWSGGGRKQAAQSRHEFVEAGNHRVFVPHQAVARTGGCVWEDLIRNAPLDYIIFRASWDRYEGLFKDIEAGLSLDSVRVIDAGSVSVTVAATKR